MRDLEFIKRIDGHIIKYSRIEKRYIIYFRKKRIYDHEYLTDSINWIKRNKPL